MRGYSSSGTLFAFPELLDAADQAKTKQEVSDPKKLSDDTSSETDAETAKNDFDGIRNELDELKKYLAKIEQENKQKEMNSEDFTRSITLISSRRNIFWLIKGG